MSNPLRPNQRYFSNVGTALPWLMYKCVFLKDTTLWHRWGLRKLRPVPPSSDTNNIWRSITGSELQVKAEHARIQWRNRGSGPPAWKIPISIGFYWKLAFGPPPPPGKKWPPPQSVGTPLEPWKIKVFLKNTLDPLWDRSGSVVECLTWNILWCVS